MNSRLRFVHYIIGVAGVLVCVSLFTLQVPLAHAQDPVPTPTYDPLEQPELPPNPTELETGRYLFWRHCMPCHGDIGQGLTDEFRVLWEEHQNCWESGCHGGKPSDEGFPIPRVVPAIVTEEHLTQFASEQELFGFLKATHPPQYPGHLEDEEYHDLAAILFRMNDRSANKEMIVPTTTSPSMTASIPTLVSTQSNTDTKPTSWILVAGIGIALFAGISFAAILKFRQNTVK